MDLEALFESRDALLAEMQGLSDKAIADKKPMSDEDLKRCDDIEAEIAKLDKTIERAKKTAAIAATQSEERRKPVGSPVSIQITRNEGEDDKGNCVVWKSMGEQLQAVHRIATSPTDPSTRKIMERMELSNKILRAATGLQESTIAEGGALVQTDSADVLLQSVHETGKLLKLVDHYSISTNSNSISFPYIDETSRANGSRAGGVRGYWAAEAAQYTASKPKVGKSTIVLEKLIGLCYMTDEILEDAAILQRFVTTEFGKEFGFLTDEAIINGSGAETPLGILNSPALVTVAKETSQTAATINGANLAKMYARLIESSLDNAVFVYNQGCKSQIMTLSLTVGSQTYPVMLNGSVGHGTLAEKPKTTILGQPAFGLEQCAALGTEGDILFFDPKEYLWIDKGGIKQAQSIHVRFEYDEQAFKFTYRANGMPKRKSAITPFKGSDTISPYISLAVRA
jgi:HK97 family phage major capsid protein